MSRSGLLIVLMFGSMVSYGQNISVTFTGTGVAAQIDSVMATNLRTNQSVSLPGNETLILTVNTGIPYVSMLTDMGIVYPNPFSDRATFTTNIQKPQTVYLMVQDLVGQVITQTEAFVEPGVNEFALSVKTAGIYLVSLITDQGTSSFEIICTNASKSENRIQYLGSGSNKHNNHNNLSQPELKSSQTSYTLAYAKDDIILYRCSSGVYTTIVTDSPTFSKNYDVAFSGCTDPVGKNYSIVKIGDQTWMAENLAYLPSVSPSSIADGSDTSPYWYVNGFEGTDVIAAKATANYTTYGVLYNWEAAKTSCPTDWHLPSDGEWKILEKYLGMTDADANSSEYRISGFVGGKLKKTGTTNWNIGASNESGFTAIPGGLRKVSGGFTNNGFEAEFWSASNYHEASDAWVRFLYIWDDGVYRTNDRKGKGFSVRCLQNVLVTVTTFEVAGITDSSATGGGNVINDGGANITARGVCWSTSSIPTTADSKTSDGAGTGIFYSSLTGLTAGTPYYVRAYATNGVGTFYGEQKQFTTSSGGGDGTFVYHDRTYAYKTLGTQTWMTENLAYLPSVSPSSAGSVTGPHYYVYGHEDSSISGAKATANYTTYGVLYNWEAAKTACPLGWHLPSDTEWTVLTDYLGTSAGSKMKEVGTTHWFSPNEGATNASGFTALPGGVRTDRSYFLYLGYYAYFWSASYYHASDSWLRSLDFENVGIYRTDYPKSFGFSVRCLKD